MTPIAAVSPTIPCRTVTKFLSKEYANFVYNRMAQTLPLPFCGYTTGDQILYELWHMVTDGAKYRKVLAHLAAI